METSNKHIAFRTSFLRKKYVLDHHGEVEVLKGVELQIQLGEWVALIGASGSGKSTLLHLLGVLETATSGDIICRGRPYSGLSSKQKALLRKEEIGFVFQSYHLLPELTAIENVMLPAMCWNWNQTDLASRAKELLKTFGLGHRFGHRPQELSGGEQQRVALARALINNPSILLADEPTGNLDASAAEEIIGFLKHFHQHNGITIVMVTHDLKLAQKAQSVWKLTNGLAEKINLG